MDVGLNAMAEGGGWRWADGVPVQEHGPGHLVWTDWAGAFCRSAAPPPGRIPLRAEYSGVGDTFKRTSLQYAVLACSTLYSPHRPPAAARTALPVLPATPVAAARSARGLRRRMMEQDQH
jgi:hypothetical protein